MRHRIRPERGSHKSHPAKIIIYLKLFINSNHISDSRQRANVIGDNDECHEDFPFPRQNPGIFVTEASDECLNTAELNWWWGKTVYSRYFWIPYCRCPAWLASGRKSVTKLVNNPSWQLLGDKPRRSAMIRPTMKESIVVRWRLTDLANNLANRSVCQFGHVTQCGEYHKSGEEWGEAIDDGRYHGISAIFIKLIRKYSSPVAIVIEVIVTAQR